MFIIVLREIRTKYLILKSIPRDKYTSYLYYIFKAYILKKVFQRLFYKILFPYINHSRNIIV